MTFPFRSLSCFQIFSLWVINSPSQASGAAWWAPRTESSLNRGRHPPQIAKGEARPLPEPSFLQCAWPLGPSHFPGAPRPEGGPLRAPPPEGARPKLSTRKEAPARRELSRDSPLRRELDPGGRCGRRACAEAEAASSWTGAAGGPSEWRGRGGPQQPHRLGAWRIQEVVKPEKGGVDR